MGNRKFPFKLKRRLPIRWPGGGLMRRRRRKGRRSRVRAAVIFGLTLVLIWRIWPLVVTAWNSAITGTIGSAMVVGAGVVAFVRMALRIERHRFLANDLEFIELSLRPRDYEIEAGDFRRGNPKENLYRKLFQLSLLEIFRNECAKCGRQDNGLDLDHFFISKKDGGSLLMKHRSGYFVNNAIPLCQSCNRSKSDRNFQDFFLPSEIQEILSRNAKMTKLINQRGLSDSLKIKRG